MDYRNIRKMDAQIDEIFKIEDVNQSVSIEYSRNKVINE